jgi:hypothetical protein
MACYILTAQIYHDLISNEKEDIPVRGKNSRETTLICKLIAPFKYFNT